MFLTAAGSAITPRRRFIISPSYTAGRAVSQGENLQIVFLIVSLKIGCGKAALQNKKFHTFT